MHHAPSVCIPVGRCVFLRRLYQILTLLTSALLLSWTWVQPWHSGMLIAVVGSTVCAVFGWRAIQQTGALTWTGQQWQLVVDHSSSPTPPITGAIDVCLDLQTVLLLRYVPSSGQGPRGMRWLWCQCPEDQALWQDFRRAVFAVSPLARKET